MLIFYLIKVLGVNVNFLFVFFKRKNYITVPSPIGLGTVTYRLQGDSKTSAQFIYVNIYVFQVFIVYDFVYCRV